MHIYIDILIEIDIVIFYDNHNINNSAGDSLT
jgi:hypothetical protein